MSKPNILIFMSDQHNPNVMGCAGDPIIRTPNMDRLAEEGMRFDRCYTAAPICVPARMSFMSGRRPNENNVNDNTDMLSSSILCWPARLRQAGYHTALIGRMHFEGPDQWHGFEKTYEDLRHWRGNMAVRNQEESEAVPAWSYWSPRESVIDLSGHGTTFVNHRDEVVTERGLQFLKEQQDEDRPFAAVIGLYNPHPPYVGEKELHNYYYDRVKVSTEKLSDMPDYLRDYASLYHNWENPEPIPEEDQRRALAAYYANCELIDRQLGRVLTEIDRLGIADNTLVIYCSDHGDMIGSKGAWGKEFFYDDSVRIPMIMRLPGTIPAATSTKRNCNLRNLGNTFCDLAGADPLQGSDACSILPVMTGREEDCPDVTESEVFRGPTCFGQDKSAAIKMVCHGPWKLWCYAIEGQDLHYSLFNLDEDPDELNDRIADESLSALKAELKEHLHQGWDYEQIRRNTLRRQANRRETDKVWSTHWQHCGYDVPADLSNDVVTPHTQSSK